MIKKITTMLMCSVFLATTAAIGGTFGNITTEAATNSKYVIKYHADDTSKESSKTTSVEYGVSTKTLTNAELGFSKAGKSFVGWKAYREIDDSWYVTDSTGNTAWTKLSNGKLPAGSSFYIYKNGGSVSKSAASGDVHFYGQWKDNRYTIKYHADDTSKESSKTTSVEYGVSTKTLTNVNLGFSKAGKRFVGWKAYRDIDDTWYVTDGSGNTAWMKVSNGKLPEGISFYIYKNGGSVSKSATSGNVHFYGQWEDNTYTVNYHLDDKSEASGKTTKVTYGTSTKLQTVSQLGFTKADHAFKGWRAYREYDGKWFLKDASGAESWQKLENAALPSGYSYVIYKDGASVAKTAPNGQVHLYGQWEANTYTVNYHLDDKSEASGKTTKVTYGTSTKLQTVSQLGFAKENYTFKGWRAYREYDGKWFLKDASGAESWQKLENAALPSGYSYVIYKDGASIAKTAPNGQVHLYGEWKDNGYTIKYHADDESNESSKTTHVQYGVSTKTLTNEELGFSKTGKSFLGWKAYRAIDDSWYVTDSTGKTAWIKLANGELPEGSSYYIYTNGISVARSAASGDVHFYGQWKDNGYTIKYHADDESNESSKTTYVQYGVSTKTLTNTDLGFSKASKSFLGWKAYREIDDSWYVTDSTGKTAWVKLANGELPEGSSYYIYTNGISVARSAASGNVHFYGQWKDNNFTIKYHFNDESEESTQTTTVEYGKSTKILTVSQLGFNSEGLVFNGWKAHREVDDTWYVTDSSGETKWTKLTNGELPEGSRFYLYTDGASVSKTATSGFVHFYGQWIPSDVNVGDHGANGKDNESDWQAIQKCLNYGKNNNEHLNVYVGEGTYYIDETLTVYSNTSLILDQNAKIVRMDQSKQMLRGEVDLVTGGYGQSHDITIKGGEWDGNITDVNEKSYGLITFNHAQGITLEDFSIKGCNTRHMVTFDGVKDVVVRNVNFADQVEYTGPDDDYTYHLEYISDKTHNPDNSFKNMEALHIDYISDDGGSAGEAYPIDGTMNQNILVENCSFNNVLSGVGSHYNDDTGKINENIIIRNNTFNNVQYTAIHVCQYNGAEVSGNTATDVGELLRINKSKEGKAVNNTATIKSFLRGDVKNAPLYGIFIYSGTELTAVENNTILGALYNGIHITEDSVVNSLQNNALTNVGEYGIYVKNSSVTNFISNSVDTVNNDGIQLMASTVDLLKENIVKNSARRGITFVESKATAIGNIIDTTEENGLLVQSSEATINNNEISNTKGHGISVIASVCGTINENKISNVTGDLKDGILTGASEITEIKNNTITGTVRDGININSNNGTGSSVNEISGNNISDYGRKGIGIYDGSTVTINENNNI